MTTEVSLTGLPTMVLPPEQRSKKPSPLKNQSDRSGGRVSPCEVLGTLS